MHIYLYGPPGSGKSTLGRLLAQSLDRAFIDLDARIEAHTGVTIAETFATHGEATFRALESQALRAATNTSPAIIALGGGALLDPQNRQLAEKHGRILFLEASSTLLAARVAQQQGQRPLLVPSLPGGANTNLTHLLAQRAAHYASFTLRLTVQDIAPEQNVARAQVVLGTYRITGMGDSYPVCIEAGLLERLLPHLQTLTPGTKTVVVGDTHTAPLYAAPLAHSLRAGGIEAHVATIPAGESTKNIATVKALWSSFIQGHLERRSLVIAVGGGIVGDLTGFAAATWLRGIRWVGLPTTLLAMVDSSLGGKTGADLPEGKNLIGAFHSPAAVWVDSTTLSTLPIAELRYGLAEVIKHAIIDDTTLVDELEHFTFCREAPAQTPCGDRLDPQRISRFVARAMAVKIRVIQEDPFEQGRRAALNLGHTIGHGIEKATDYQIKHGEAVAIGTVLEAQVAEALGLAHPGLATELAQLFQLVGLPTTLPRDISIAKILQAMAFDKKKAQGVVRFALPIKMGEVRTGIQVDNATLEKILQ